MVAAGVFISTPVFAARFVDTGKTWTEHYVNVLSDKGVIPAESDGKFRPDEPVTRAQLAVWLVKVLGLDKQPVAKQSSFPDVKPTDWFFKSVEIIRQNNIISGYADGFRPNQYIQRAEVLSILSRTLNIQAPDDAAISAELAKYSDGGKVPTWAKIGVAEASMCGVFVNEPSPNRLDPTDIAKRGETAALLSKLDEYMLKQKEHAAALNPSVPGAGEPPSGAGGGAPPATTVYAPPYQSPSGYQGGPPSGYGAGAPSGYGGYPPAQPYAGQVSAQGGYQQPPYAPGPGQYAPYGTPLQGGVAVVAAGTKFSAQLKSTLDSASSQPGEEVAATLPQPLYGSSGQVIPAGSRLIGNVSNVVPARRLKAGANGKIDIKFTSIETPDGRRFPLSASVDGTQVHLSGGTTAGRVGKGLMTTAIGAGSGAVLGTALGAIVGSTSGSGRVGKSTAMGAVFGTAIGGGIGAVGGVVRKGSDVKLTAGMSIPVQLDQSLQVSPPAMSAYPPQPQYGYAPPGSYPPAGYAPVQQPVGYYPPQ